MTDPRTAGFTLAWALIIWVVVFWRLGYASLLDPDEAHYAQMTREMMRARQWLVPLLEGRPYIDKPVLYHWLQTISVALFGESALALRLPGACAAVALFATVRWAGTQFFGATSGNRAAAMFATLPLTFALASVAVFDMEYSAFLFGGLACLMVAAAHDRPRLELIGWPLIALAVMTKGPVALLLILMLGIACVVQRSTRAFVARLHYGAGPAFVALAASPWFVYMAVTFGDRFVHDYLLAGNLWYFTRPQTFSTRQSDVAFYVRTFVGAFFPWSFVTIGAGIDAVRRLRRGDAVPPEERVLWTWTVVILAFFTAARFKLDAYIFPAAPAACMLAAHAWTRAAAARSDDTAWTRIAVRLLAVVMIVAAPVLGIALFQIDLGVPWSALFMPLALMAGGSVILWQIRRHGTVPASAAIPVMTLLAVYVVVQQVGLPILERSRPTAPIGHWVARHTPAGVPVGVYGLEDWRASIRYYSERDMVPLPDGIDVYRFVSDHPGAYVLMLARDYTRLVDVGMPLHVVGGKPAIVGRSGKYVRHQVWGRIVVVTDSRTSLMARNDIEADLPDAEEVP